MGLNKHAKDKLYGYVTRTLGMRPYLRGWLKGTCPDCGRQDKFGVNLYMNRTNCFVCGYHPTPINLITDLEGFSTISEAWDFLKTYDGLRYLEPIIERIKKVQIKLPESYTNIAFGNSLIARSARKHLRNRGFDLDDASLKGWGYCTSGDYMGYLILPFYVGGTLVYFNGRRIVGPGSKYKNPAIEDFGIGKSMIVYNLDALAIYKDIYILEGVFNAETLGEDALAMGGKKISDYQISMVNKSHVESITILLDPDAYYDAIKLALQFVFHKKVKITLLPDDNDVNDIGKKKTMKLIEKEKWLSHSDILKLKYSHETRTKHTYL